MNYKIVAIKDTKIGAFQPPIFVSAIGYAERAFLDAVENPKKDTDISKHPADFELWLLGEFDDNTGAIENQQLTYLMSGATINN